MATGILITLLLLIMLLAFPLTLYFQLTWRQTLTSHLRLHWAFGLVQVTLPPINGKPFDTKTRTKSTSKSNKSFPLKPNLASAIVQRAFRKRVTRFIQDLWQSLKKQDLKLHLRIGLDDPCETGRLWALCGPITALLFNTEGADIAIEPVFTDKTLEVQTSGQIRVIPLQVVYLVFAFFLSPTIWKALKGGNP